MNVQTRQCDPRRIADFLGRRLSEAAQAAFEDHLSECEDCRELLGAQTADHVLWDKASRYLRDDECELEPLSGLGDSTAECDHSFSIQHVLDALGPTDDPQMLGRLGGYEISGVVGSGGMGVVLKALDKSLDRTVAIKVMAPHLASSGAARQRFAREAKAAAAVLHPNVMAIHSVSNGESSLPFLVMPYMRGTSLQKRLDVEGPLPTSEILRIAAQTAAGLAAAHAQGLVHRDIKPANIMLEEGVERVAITDFGLARAVDDASMTRTGVVAGTPQYMSPEQARGESVDQSSDLFSLGSVLYAMCTGRPPFRAESSYGVLRRITDDEPTAIRELNPEIPEWLCAIIARLMSKHPSDRYRSAAEAAELLEDCLAHVQQPTTVPLPKSVALQAANRGGQRPFIRLLVAAAFAFSLIFAGILIVLELNKGKLTIECEVDDIPIRIVQGEDVVDRLVVSKSGKTIRIAAGSYQVEIEGNIDGIALADGRVTLQRGGKDTVKIVRSTGAGGDAVTIEAPRDAPGDIILRGRKDAVVTVQEAIQALNKKAGGGAAEEGKAAKNDEPPVGGRQAGVALVMLMHPAELEGGNSVQQAAASVALGQLSSHDYCGILKYSKETPQTPSWLWGGKQGVVRIGERRAELLKSISGSDPGDFPQFDPALRMALTALSRVDVIRRHMIVLTNGDPDVTDDGTLKAFREAGIAISVVHIELHGTRYEATPKRMAAMTGGRYYHVLNGQPSVVEAIFRSEATRLAQNRLTQADGPETVGATAPQDAGDEVGIQGEWKVIAITKNQRPPPKLVEAIGYLIEGETLVPIVHGRVQSQEVVMLKLNDATNPKQIDLTPKRGDRKTLGIYVVAGDRLQICSSEGERPQHFEADKDGVTLMVLERVKAVAGLEVSETVGPPDLLEAMLGDPRLKQAVDRRDSARKAWNAVSLRYNRGEATIQEEATAREAYFRQRAVLQDALKTYFERKADSFSLNVRVRQLLLQRAAERGVKVSRAEVTSEKLRIAQTFGIAVDALALLIEKERGVTAEQWGREIIEPYLLLRKLAGGKENVTAYHEELRVQVLKSLESEIGEE